MKTEPRSLEMEATLRGVHWHVTTGLVTLNAGGSFGLFYLSNSGSAIQMDNLSVSASRDGVVLQFVEEPSGGTLISGGTALTAYNAMIGGATMSAVTLKKAAAASATLTGGNISFAILSGGTSDFGSIASTVLIPSGVAVGVLVTTPVGLSVDFIVSMGLFRLD